MASDPFGEVKAWVQEQWDPELTVRDWWARLGAAGWAVPTWPAEWHGRGLSGADNTLIQKAIVELGAMGPPWGLGLLIAGPTIIAHGTEEQKHRYLPGIVTGRVGWCQLFSEPVAGSDLAGLQTRAERDGDEWVVTGQKVWTSAAHTAEVGMLLARTDQDAPKHKGITFFALDMRQPGVEVRPLRELTGRALFNEVFLTEVRVRADALIGGEGNGWAVANTALALERTNQGAGAATDGGASAVPGMLAGDLDRRAGVIAAAAGSSAGWSPRGWATAQTLIDAARRHHLDGDPLARQGIAAMYTEQEIGRIMTLRQKSMQEVGRDLPGGGNIGKLRMSQMFRMGREIGLGLLGARGMLHDYGDPAGHGDDIVTALGMWSPGPSIYGGTDEVQRNILAERVLGLPREPGDDRATPFRELRRNG